MTNASGFPASGDLHPEEDRRAAPVAPGGAAQRALAEARQRRLQAVPATTPEVNGRGGLDPARYGDWEVDGIARDF